MTKIETAIDDWYCGNDAILTIPERCALAEVVERLIDERTEQCAKIAEDRIRFIVNRPESKLDGFDLEGWHIKSYCEASAREAQTIMDAIRDLNTEIKS